MVAADPPTNVSITDVSCTDQPTITAAQAERVFTVASNKLAAAIATPYDRYPSGALADTSSFVRTGPHSWTSGFFPGQLWLLAKHNQGSHAAQVWINRARAHSAGLESLAHYTGTHDLGFMVGLPFGIAGQVDPDPSARSRYLTIRQGAGQSLSQRWNPNIGAFTSGNYQEHWGTIIDSAMNAAFLIESGSITPGDVGATLRARGVTHLRTLITHFIRDDGSTRHRLIFDPTSGDLLGPTPGQGLSADSTWSRGQAWAILGFARAYELTGEPDFLAAATRTADYWISRTPASCVPTWDYDDPDPAAPLDSSAAAIAALGMQTLARIAPEHPQSTRYRDNADATLGVLAGPGWVQSETANPGVLQRQSHAVPDIRKEGSYSWGDAYLLLALSEKL